ncbi:hypothetical protein V1291_002277 [Nitrobacteraceae bacterium AZCC 1564]
MKRFVLGLSIVICSICTGVSGSSAAPARGNAIMDAATGSLIEPAYVYRRSVYGGTRYAGCRRVRTCSPNGCVYVRRCW